MSRFHFHEYDDTRALRDDVDLDAARADVACEDAIASAGEMRGGARFAFGPERTAAIGRINGHVSGSPGTDGARRAPPYPMATLHVVATPIGNLEDVTLRALRVLRESALVLAEDTRRTRVLLDRHGVPARPRSLHAHNEASRVDEALGVLRTGGDVALVSDAGTPLVSDPGARLVAAVLGDGHRVSPVPGASAVLAALTVSGFSADAFTFLGFLPRRAGVRATLLARHRSVSHPVVLFESPRRVATTLVALRAALGDRAGCVARGLTKLHEEVAHGTLGELAQRFAEGARGEVTIVVDGAPATASDTSRNADSADATGEATDDAAVDAAAHAGGRLRRAIAQRGSPASLDRGMDLRAPSHCASGRMSLAHASHAAPLRAARNRGPAAFQLRGRPAPREFAASRRRSRWLRRRCRFSAPPHAFSDGWRRFRLIGRGRLQSGPAGSSRATDRSSRTTSTSSTGCATTDSSDVRRAVVD